jgi:hypothetical protein
MTILPTEELVWSHPGLVWTENEILPAPEFDHRSAQPVAGIYTDCTTLAPLSIWRQSITVMCTVSCTVDHAKSIVIIVAN